MPWDLNNPEHVDDMVQLSTTPITKHTITRVGAPTCGVCGAHYGACIHTGGPGDASPVLVADVRFEREELWT